MYETLVNLLESAGYEVDDYSGRGMFGAVCPSITLDERRGSLWTTVANLFDRARENDCDWQVVQTAIRNVHTDSMGMATILYFPDFQKQVANA